LDSLTFDVRLGVELFFVDEDDFARGVFVAAVFDAEVRFVALVDPLEADFFVAGVFFAGDFFEVLRAAIGRAPCRWIGGL
jgi:hypothetical protein